MRFAIVSRRKWFFLLSGTITLAGLIVMLIFGLNLGTDFKSGSQVQIVLNQPFNAEAVRAVFIKQGLPVGPEGITAAGTNNQMAVVRLSYPLSNAQEGKLNAAIKASFPKALVPPEYSTVDPIIAQEQSQTAVWAVLLASLGIVIYVAIRFEYRFAVAGIAALLHDAFIVISVFALLRLEVDLPFIAAVLTIVGYSINDTIVIFDRIRENLKGAKVKTLKELETLVDHSLWQTMARSINTVLTVLFAAMSLFFFGGDPIHNFCFALLVGLISGAYSSIFIASPIWVAWRGRAMARSQQTPAKA
ncbi:protein translocase subunit SecF [Sulfoacidibacillus thermotolerans]|uniref:Protein-export membrane protein SecF n=1 Tax=Sulfoacidibacillus thermotolerans TaxID=1765684 RepID=A0A2U3DB67_SULT2|nr:protein translocase subunit SecF [Sulfoacidibacillus thermotolerans]PWI58528.1 protein-export membrane protein SecF [Sulfoacidibacillus thermotolerans]